MALNAKVLGDSIASALTHPQATPEIVAQIQAQWEVIAGLIIAHIQTAGLVNVSVSGFATVASFGVPGPVTGSGTGTLS